MHAGAGVGAAVAVAASACGRTWRRFGLLLVVGSVSGYSDTLLQRSPTSALTPGPLCLASARPRAISAGNLWQAHLADCSATRLCATGRPGYWRGVAKPTPGRAPRAFSEPAAAIQRHRRPSVGSVTSRSARSHALAAANHHLLPITSPAASPDQPVSGSASDCPAQTATHPGVSAGAWLHQVGHLRHPQVLGRAGEELVTPPSA
jgi:hypothetical protein